jgi:hypothetical protein
MSSESDFDDEDLSAPPKKKPTIKKETDVKTMTMTMTATATETAAAELNDDTMDDEEIEELSPDQYRTSVKRKQDSLSPKMDKYASMVKRKTYQGTFWYVVCSI